MVVVAFLMAAIARPLLEYRQSCSMSKQLIMCPVFLAGNPARVRPDRQNHDGTGRQRRDPVSISRASGRSSVVERQLPKLYVEGSIPFARSILTLSPDFQ